MQNITILDQSKKLFVLPNSFVCSSFFSFSGGSPVSKKCNKSVRVEKSLTTKEAERETRVQRKTHNLETGSPEKKKLCRCKLQAIRVPLFLQWTLAAVASYCNQGSQQNSLILTHEE